MAEISDGILKQLRCGFPGLMKVLPQNNDEAPENVDGVLFAILLNHSFDPLLKRFQFHGIEESVVEKGIALIGDSEWKSHNHQLCLA